MTPGLVRTLIRDRSFTLKVWMTLLTGVSLLCWAQIPKEVLPRESTPAFLYVSVEAREPSSVEQMEMLLGLPLEGLAKTLPGLTQYQTSVSSRGVSLSLTFRPRTPMDEITFQLNEGLQSMAELGLLDPQKATVNQLNPEAVSVMKFSLRFERMKNPVKAIKEELRSVLEAIPQVSKVEIIGLEPRLLQLRVPAHNLVPLGLTPSQFLARVRTESLRESVGEMQFAGNDLSLGVLFRSSAVTLPEVLQKPVDFVSRVRLQDLGSMEVRSKKDFEVFHDTGEYSAFLEIYHREGANLFDLNNEIQKVLTSLPTRQDDLSQLDVRTIFDRTEDLKMGIDEVVSALGQAMVITFFVVALFLRHLGLTILVSLSIPLSLLFTVMIMYIHGSSLNLLSLSGLILSVGMVVDNAVIVIENIQKKRALGLTSGEATAEGAAEMAPALLMSTLSTITIFLPVAFVESGDSFTDILKAFQLPMIAALISGFVISLLFVPIAAGLVAVNRDYEKKMDRFQHRINKWVTPVFRFVFRHRNAALLATFVTTFAIGNWVRDIELVDLEPPRDPFVQVQVRYGAETKPEERRAAFLKLEAEFLRRRTDLGFRVLLAELNPDFMFGSFQFYPDQLLPQDQDLDQMQARIRDQLQLTKFTAGEFADFGEGGAHAAVAQRQTFRFYGPRISGMLEIQNQLAGQLSALPGVANVKTEAEERGTRSIIFVPNRATLVRSGIELGQIATQISSRNGGTTVSGLHLNGEAILLKVSVIERDRMDMDSLSGFRVRTDRGGEIPLADLGEFRKEHMMRSGARKKGVAQTQMGVYFADGLSSAESSRVRTRVSELVAKQTYPTGYGLVQNQAPDFSEMNQKSLFLVGLAVFLIYLFLGSLYESLLAPLAILVTVPISIVFGLAGLQVLGMPLDVMGRFSLIILTGVAINASIILVDLIRQLQREGYSLEVAIHRGCSERFMAVLMSSSIQVLGVLPIALGNSKIMGIPYSSLGVSIISGMIFSTILTLLVLPAVYAGLEQVGSRFTQRRSSRLTTSKQNPEAEGFGSRAA